MTKGEQLTVKLYSLNEKIRRWKVSSLKYFRHKPSQTSDTDSKLAHNTCFMALESNTLWSILRVTTNRSGLNTWALQTLTSQHLSRAHMSGQLACSWNWEPSGPATLLHRVRSCGRLNRSRRLPNRYRDNAYGNRYPNNSPINRISIILYFSILLHCIVQWVLRLCFRLRAALL
jgi:hypothetical protein